jgi:hypothetical protein
MCWLSGAGFAGFWSELCDLSVAGSCIIQNYGSSRAADMLFSAELLWSLWLHGGGATVWGLENSEVRNGG